MSYNEINENQTTIATSVEETPFLAFMISKFVKKTNFEVFVFLFKKQAFNSPGITTSGPKADVTPLVIQRHVIHHERRNSFERV